MAVREVAIFAAEAMVETPREERISSLRGDTQKPPCVPWSRSKSMQITFDFSPVVFRASFINAKDECLSCSVSENTSLHVGDCPGFHEKGFSVSVTDCGNTFSKENAHRRWHRFPPRPVRG